MEIPAGVNEMTGEIPAAMAKQSAQEPPVADREAESGKLLKACRLWEVLAVAGLLLVLAAQLAMSARRESATMDEQNHIARGLAYLRTGDTRLNRLHPPIIGALSALPLLLDSQVKLPLDSGAWQSHNVDAFAEDFLWIQNQNGPTIVAWARLPIMFLTLLLGVTCYLWGRELYGVYAGLVALFLLTFDPNILAHGKLATNDLGVTFFSTASLYAFWRFLGKSDRLRATVAGGLLGLALTAKFSALFLIVAQLLMAIAHHWLNAGWRRNRQELLKSLWLYGLMMVVTGLVVWAVYGFKIGALNETGPVIPAPDYLKGLQLVLARVDSGNPSFLFGEYSGKGWWYYFPCAFAVKTPLPTLLLIGAAFIYTIRRRNWQAAAMTLIPVALFFALSLASSLNIGYRHLLPILPLLFIFAGQTTNLLRQPGHHPAQPAEKPGRWATGLWRRDKWAMALLVPFLWLAIETAYLFPDYLAYFNQLVGGSGQGYRVLADSNLDWGQGLIQLREHMEKEGLTSVKLSYFGSAYPEKYGIVYEALPAFPRNIVPAGVGERVLSNPPAGVYAISVTSLQGLFFTNHQLYGWFRDRKPDAVIAGSIFIYRVP
jgi:hypothetical protein